AGTHGKTTTTSMLAWILEVAGKSPSFLIGGIAENFGSSFAVHDQSRHFIIEGDEYDTAFFDKGPKFLHYFPDALILTSVEFGDFEFPLAGQYNVLNATAAAALASHYQIDPATIAKALAGFRSVKRRLEVKAEIAGITLIDDFAHHPTAVAETLKALRARYAGRRL